MRRTIHHHDALDMAVPRGCRGLEQKKKNKGKTQGNTRSPTKEQLNVCRKKLSTTLPESNNNLLF